ncbi:MULTISPECIES: ABC transporter permease [unclassified Pseudonocardia]|uniref:ABC transporter permease n=1 Tax=unclassified Pseudonocardia TaxID=2619320 RepID=UPI0001FFE9A7|nr:ABC transporter permease [Pseudonocardia sp. Ae707_Ps1]OLM18480.1 Dipeptide transport system permease protein DppB [Pseudonocardia sp. Ae707_Ps1]
MLGLLVRRLAFTVPMLVVVSFCVFSLIVLVPGDPAVALAGENPDPAQIAAVRERLGLDDPFLLQFWNWFSGVVQGDLGQSLFSSQPVSEAVFSRLPATLSLALLSLAVALVLGVTVGVVAAMRPGSRLDRVATFAASLGVAVPYFWVGMILVLLLAINAAIFPAVGYVPLTENPLQWFLHLVLPATALGLAPAAVIARQTRAGMTGVLREDYVRTATAKGLPPARVVGRHALKNAAVPVVTAFGLEASRLIGGTVVIEQLFALPGLGSLAYTSVFARDFPMVQGVLLVVAALVLLINLLVDLSYGYFDPRIRQS